MANTTKPTTTKPGKAAPAVATAPNATPAAATVAPAVAPAAAALAAARTSTQQAAAWHAACGNTMPPAALPLATGKAPAGKQGGQRWQHGTALHAACVALGTGATVATVAQWCKVNGAKVPGCAQHGALAGAGGNVRCALAGGVLVVPR